MAVRGKKEFLEGCDADDGSAFDAFFRDTELLAGSSGDPNPADSGHSDSAADLPLRLRWEFDDRTGAVLRLRHSKLTAGPLSVLWAQPSRNHGRPGAANGIYAHAKELGGRGVRAEDVEAFRRALVRAGFEDKGEITWQSKGSGTAGGFSTLYQGGNRTALSDAIRGLVMAINRY